MKDIEVHFFENSETYKDLFDNAHDLIHIVQADGKIIYVNKAWKEVLGYEQEEIHGKSIYFFVDTQDRDRFIEYRENIINGNATDKEIIICLVAKTGNKVFVEGFVSLKVVKNKPLYTRGIFRDVTERLKNETKLKVVNEELKERERNLQQLLFYAPDAIVVIDTHSIIKYWNPKAEIIFGWSNAEVVGRSLTELVIPKQHRAAHTYGMKRYLTTGEAHVLNKTIDITAINKKGKEFYVSLTISKTIQKGKTAFIAFIRDIDQQKRIALELEEKRAQLELSNQELEQFAHVASHDMKEPIRKIMIFTDQLDSLASEALSSRSKNYLTKIQNAANRLMEMVEGVLAYSSLSAEKPAMEKVNLNTIIKDVETDLELVIQQKRAVIKYTDLPEVIGAPFLLYQLFYNLINNALKFSKHEVEPVIEITANTVSTAQIEHFALAPHSFYFEVVVKDNGIGFSQEYADVIFKTFSRLHTRDQYEGTGLGLSLCKSIVEKHKGVIKAFGKQNDGAAFVILLPGQQSSTM